MVLEHELMHHETLLYMVQQLPAELKRGPDVLPAPPRGKGRRAGFGADSRGDLRPRGAA